MDEDELEQYVHLALEGAHIIGDTSEVVGLFALAGGAGEKALVVKLGHWLGPIGMIASTIIVLCEVVKAFGTGTRLQEQQGFCYGVMWQVFELPNADKEFVAWFDDSAEDLRDSFYAGVDQGCSKAEEPKVRNRVLLAVSYYMLQGDNEHWAQIRVLNHLWDSVAESDKGADWLDWPKPAGMQPLIP